MKAQQESTEAQIQAQREVAEEDRKVLLKQMIKQAGQIDALTGELVDSKRKHSTVASSRGPKPVAPWKLLPEISVSKFKAWLKAWDDYADMCQAESMSLEEKQVLFRSTLLLEMRHILEERIVVDLKHGPDEILDEIEKFIRRKRSIMLNMVDFETRQHKLAGNLDSYMNQEKDIHV